MGMTPPRGQRPKARKRRSSESAHSADIRRVVFEFFRRNPQLSQNELKLHLRDVVIVPKGWDRVKLESFLDEWRARTAQDDGIDVEEYQDVPPLPARYQLHPPSIIDKGEDLRTSRELQARVHVEKQNPSRRLTAPPGHTLLSFADVFFSRKTLDEVLRPTIVDMRAEYNEALAEGRLTKARLIRIRGTWAFFKAAGLVKALGFVKVVIKVWRLIP